MSIELTLPIEIPLEEGKTVLDPIEAAMDRIVIFKRVDAETYTELADLPLGTATYTDTGGVINDEFHVRFKDSINGVSSLPSHIYRALNPYKQRNEENPPVAIILELQTTSTVPTVDFVGIYRRKQFETDATRIALVAIGQQFYQDPDGDPGDVYHSTFVDTTNGTESQPSAYLTANANTGLVVVSGRFEDPAGDLYARPPEPPASDDDFDIEIRLVVPREANARAPTAQGQTIGIVVKKILTQESTGFWSTTLVPNDLIEPNNTFYEFLFRGRTYFKYVNSANGEAQNFAMLAEARPRFFPL